VMWQKLRLARRRGGKETTMLASFKAGTTVKKLDEAAYGEFAKLLGDRVATYAPDWTDHKDGDPGVTLIELFAFLAESLLYRANGFPERGRNAADRLAKFALTLANRDDDGTDCTLERPRYFPGQVLGIEDHTLEQNYFRRRIRRLNRELHGSGVVRGLTVSVQSSSSAAKEQVVVMPGFALMPDGEEVEVCSVQIVDAPNDGGLSYVILRHAETLSHPKPVANGGQQFARVDEQFAFRFDAATAEDGVALARLLREKNSWHIDNEFKPRRVV
jgi:hypothetical protein